MLVMLIHVNNVKHTMLANLPFHVRGWERLDPELEAFLDELLLLIEWSPEVGHHLFCLRIHRGYAAAFGQQSNSHIFEWHMPGVRNMLASTLQKARRHGISSSKTIGRIFLLGVQLVRDFPLPLV